MKFSRDRWSTALSGNNPKHQFRLGRNWLKNSHTKKDRWDILKASSQQEPTVPFHHSWGKPLLTKQEINGSFHHLCLVPVRLHLFESPIQEGGEEAGWDPAGDLLKCSEPRALLWGELEGIKLAESDDGEVKTGRNSSPEAMQRQLKRWWSQTLLSSSSDQGNGQKLWLWGRIWTLGRTSSPENWNKLPDRLRPLHPWHSRILHPWYSRVKQTELLLTQAPALDGGGG